MSNNWSIGTSKVEPAEMEVDSGASVSAQLSIAFESGVNGTSNVPEAPNRNAAKLEFGYMAAISFTACLATSKRLSCSSEPYCASATAMEPVTSTATTTSVVLIARLFVDETMLGVNAMMATSAQIIDRLAQAQTVSSLWLRLRI